MSTSPPNDKNQPPDEAEPERRSESERRSEPERRPEAGRRRSRSRRPSRRTPGRGQTRDCQPAGGAEAAREPCRQASRARCRRAKPGATPAKKPAPAKAKHAHVDAQHAAARPEVSSTWASSTRRSSGVLDEEMRTTDAPARRRRRCERGLVTEDQLLQALAEQSRHAGGRTSTTPSRQPEADQARPREHGRGLQGRAAVATRTTR